MQTARLLLEPATSQQLEKLIAGDTAFTAAFGLSVSPGYMDFPEALPYTLEVLRNNMIPARWWTYLFIHAADQTLIGMGGFQGAPDENGSVEIGYSVAPAYQGQGYATEAAQALIADAFTDVAVQSVSAHTLAAMNASAHVLKKCGMSKVAELTDPEVGDIWRWQITRGSQTGYD